MMHAEILYPFTNVSFPPPLSPPWALETVILLAASITSTILDSTDK